MIRPVWICIGLACGMIATQASAQSTSSAPPSSSAPEAPAPIVVESTASSAPATITLPISPPPPPPSPLVVPLPIGGAWSPVPARGMVLGGAPGSGITLATTDDFFSVNLRARLQLREGVAVATSATAPTAVTNELTVRTARLIVSGNIFSRAIQYGLQLGFAPADIDPINASPLYDAWASLSVVRDLQVRIGQFLVPFDRVRANAEWGLEFVDRAGIAGELGLDRDLGLELGSNNLGGVNLFGYRLGVFSGDGRNRVNPNPGFLYLARFNFNPLGSFDDSVEGDVLRVARPRLSIGVAGAFNQNTTRARSTFGAILTGPGFDYVHAAADATFKWRGFYFLAQVLYRHAFVDQHTVMTMMTTLTEYSRSGMGYSLQAGMMATEHLEFAARWEQLFAAPDTDPALVTTVGSAGNDASVGINWYQWGHGLKIQSDYHYGFGNDAAHGRHLARLQLQISI